MEAIMGGFTSMIGGMFHEAIVAGPARRQLNQDRERYSAELFRREKEAVDKQNVLTKKEVGRVLGAKRMVGRQLSVSQMADAQRQSQRFTLLSQDFLQAAGATRERQVAAYSSSGALVRGSAIARLEMTREQGKEGENRLKKAADIALRRGSQQARITREESAIRPAYVPLPDPVLQPNVPVRSSFNPLGAFLQGFGSGLGRVNWNQPFGSSFGGASTGGGGSRGQASGYGGLQAGGYQTGGAWTNPFREARVGYLGYGY